jgi:hypothetical protein
MCGAKALHVLEHLRHHLLICQVSLPLRLPLRHHILASISYRFPPLFF